MQHLLLVDETFDLNFIQEYHLSIQFNLDGFSFCIRDGLQNKYVYLFHKEISDNPQFLIKKLTDIYSEFKILEAEFKSTRIFYSSPAKTNLIPAHFFSEKEAKYNYQLNRKLEEGEELFHLPVKKFNSIIQVAIAQKLKTFLQEKHPGIIFQNDVALFLNQCISKAGDQPLMVIHLYQNLVSIYVIEESISFFNSFYYSNENDLLYYILNVTKSMQKNDFKILLNGRVNKRSVIYHRLSQYFKEITIVGRTSEVYYSYLFDQLPDARFVNLLNSYS